MVQVVQDKSPIVYKIKVKAIKIQFFQVSNKSSVFSKISQINPSSSISVKKVEINIPDELTSQNNCGWAKILVVDDQIINRMILVEFGNSHGLKSEEAENGKIAYQMYKKSINRQCWNGYKLIFMDLNMPVMDGMRATQKILSCSDTNSKPKIIAVTAFANDNEKEKCFEVGMNGFKTKPITSNHYKDILMNF